MFQFTGFPSIRYGLAYGYMRSSHVGFPIQKSPDHRIFAPPRSLSQLITSFIGSQCQGIRPALFFAWPFRYYSVNIWRLVGLLFLYFSLLSQRLVSSLSLRLTYFRCFIYAVFKVHSFSWLMFYQPFKHKISFMLKSLVKPVIITAFPRCIRLHLFGAVLFL